MVSSLLGVLITAETKSDSEAIDVKPTPETPAVVLTTNGVSLADRLRLADLPLATTPGGKAFCLKALHPSEHTIKSARVPGGNENSVAICCDMVATIPIPTANSSMTVVASPSIVCPTALDLYDGNTHVYTNMYNAAFGGSAVASPTVADTVVMMNRMLGKISKYRVTSQSVTVELIAPALSDQGTITASQFNLVPRTVSYSTATSTNLNVVVDGAVYPDPPLASQWILGTSAYTAKARDGAYLPLKINSFKWREFNDTTIINNVPQSQLDFTSQVLSIASNLTFPYHENRTAATTFADLAAVPKLCGSNFGLVAIQGMAANVAVRVRARQVVEISCKPSTTYAPLLEAPLPPDDHAMAMYSEVSARMMDAYPASYNDLGKLFGTISKIGKAVVPYVSPALDMISKLPGPVGEAVTAAKSAMPAAKQLMQTAQQVGSMAVQAYRNRRNRKKSQKPPPPPPRKPGPVQGQRN